NGSKPLKSWNGRGPRPFASWPPRPAGAGSVQESSMRSLFTMTALSLVAGLSACATGPAPMVATAAEANAAAVCGGTTYVDANNDGYISGDEWNAYRTSSYGY